MRSVIKAGIATAMLAPAVAGLNAIGIKGNEFIDGSDGSRFQLVGVAYQPGGSSGYDPTTHKDPMSDADRCRRDAAVMQSIGSNTVRIYNLDPEIDHDECASIFNAAGIYMVIDVNSPLPNESLNEVSIKNSYNEVYMERLFKVIDQFAGYPNTLAFFAANELISKPEYAKDNAPYIRAVIRDMHQYMRARSGMRVVPTGYSAADIRDILKDTTSYLTCAADGDSNNDSRADFIGLNGYSWCGDTTDWVKGQYQELAQFYEGASYPLFMSEYGCNEVTPRKFNEISTIYNPKQFGMISGGLAYEYTQEDNKYGLVNVKSDNELEFLEDMDTLSAKLAGIDRSALTKANDSATSVQIPKCDKSLIKGDKIPNSWSIPKPNAKISDLIKNGANGKKGSIKSDVSLTPSSDLKASWHNGSDYKFALNKVSTTDGTAGYNAPGGGSVAAGAQGATSGKSSTGAGAAITPAAQTGIFIGALTWLLASM